MLIRRFDFVADGGQVRVVEGPTGRYGVAAALLPRLDRRARAAVVFFTLEQEQEQEEGASFLEFGVETAIAYFQRCIQHEYRVHPGLISWFQRTDRDEFDWIRPDLRAGELTGVSWRPVLMPPHAPRSRAALLAIHPDLERILAHLRLRGFVRAH